MSTSTTTSPEATPAVATAPLLKAWETVQKAEGAVSVALDKFRLVAKTEAVKEKWSKKQLNAVLLTLGIDKFRASEISGWVFPTNVENRNVLDDIAAFNAKQTDLKKRIGKEAILGIQRSEVPVTEKTADEVLAKLQTEKAEEIKTRAARPPGSETQPHGSAAPAAPKTKEQINTDLQNLLAAALNFAKANGYDLADVHAEVDIVAAMVKIDGAEADDEAAPTAE